MRRAFRRSRLNCSAIAAGLPGSKPGWSGIVIDRHLTKRRYLAAFLPLLSAERASRSNAAPPDTPFALVEKVHDAVRLAALDSGALKLGLAPGMSLADARARVPELAAIDHNPAA